MIQTKQTIQKTFELVNKLIEDIPQGGYDGHKLQRQRDELCCHYSFLTEQQAKAEREHAAAEYKLKTDYALATIGKCDMPLNRAEQEIKASEEYRGNKTDAINKKYAFRCLSNKVDAISKKLDSLASAIRLAQEEKRETSKQI